MSVFFYFIPDRPLLPYLRRMEYDETVYACALNRVFNYNCRDARRLTDMFASPGDIFALSERELLELLGDGGHYSSALKDPRTLKTAWEEVKWVREHGIRIIYIRDREYPGRLRECPDAPVILFHMGRAELNHARTIAIVGTRKATVYGREQCRRIVESLSRLSVKPAVISGLAYGIDITAHTAAMEYGLPTIAVLPTGLDSIYPPQHRQHAVRIAGQGALVTDFPKGSTPMAVTFLRRNRIIAGMSDGVVLVESAEKGGGLITARTALSYSREVMAVPGRVGDPLSAGCNRLIEANAAALISSPESVASYMGWNDRNVTGRREVLEQLFEKSDYIRRNILLALSVDSVLSRNELIRKSGADPSDTLAALTEMELDGTVGSDIYGNYILKV